MSESELSFATANEIAASLENRWIECTLAADIDGLLAVFSENVIFFGSHPELYVGQQALRRYMSSVQMGGDLKIAFQERQLQVLAPTIFTTTSYVLFRAENAGKPVSFRWGISWTVMNIDNDWKVVQHHASAREQK